MRCATMASRVRYIGGHMLNTKVLVFERERESHGSEKKEKKQRYKHRASNGSRKNEEKRSIK